MWFRPAWNAFNAKQEIGQKADDVGFLSGFDSPLPRHIFNRRDKMKVETKAWLEKHKTMIIIVGLVAAAIAYNYFVGV